MAGANGTATGHPAQQLTGRDMGRAGVPANSGPGASWGLLP